MIDNYSFYGFPRRYTRYSNYYYPHPVSQLYPQSVSKKVESPPVEETCISDTSRSKSDEKKKGNDVVFEILGIKLHFDDILLICLIFFLYNEGVQDQYLFIALILLLLS